MHVDSRFIEDFRVCDKTQTSFKLKLGLKKLVCAFIYNIMEIVSVVRPSVYVALFVSFQLFLCPMALETTLVTLGTKLGQVRGSAVTISGIRPDQPVSLLVEGGGDSSALVISQFLGIPYALPPTGNLRFLKPRRHPGWTARNGPLEALVAPPACPGGALASASSAARGLGLSIDEDCLYLNIYVTRNLSAVEHVNVLQLPTVVFIGRSTSDVEQMLRSNSKWQNVVAVSIQYRRGVFGFLTLDDDDRENGGKLRSTRKPTLPGNVGLHDQQAALHWIWDNVREFGGDPDRITVVGEGDNGDVTFHLVSPASRGLFRAAILTDSSAVTRCCTSLNLARKMSRQLLDEVACSTTGYSGADVLRCLQVTDLTSLWQAADRVTTSFSTSWSPIVDGDFLPENPRDAVTSRHFNPASLLLGITSSRRQEALGYFETKLQVKQTEFDSRSVSKAIEFLLDDRFAELTNTNKPDAAASDKSSQSSASGSPPAVAEFAEASYTCRLEYFGRCNSPSSANSTLISEKLSEMYSDVTYGLSAHLLATHYSLSEQSVFIYETADTDNHHQVNNLLEQEAWLNFAMTR